MPIDYGKFFGTASGAGTLAPPATPSTPSAISLEKMLAEAARLAGIEDSRHAAEYGRLEQAGRDFTKGFEQDDERATSLALGSSLDSIGQGSLDQGRALRTSLGGRGIDPSSGTAAALAGRLAIQKEGLKYGAMRSAALDSYERRNAQRTAQYAQQAALAQFGNQSPSLLNLDALTSKAEFDLADLVSQRESDTARYVAKKGAKAQKAAGIGNIIGSALGAI